MSYRCQQCNCQVPHNTPCMRVVVQKRDKVYTTEEGHYIGEGWEIDQELLVCSSCEKELAPQNI